MLPLSRVDHVVIAVKNLTAAAASYRRLGFTLTPRGLHEGKGTGNHCIMFAQSYIELLGIVDETGAKGRFAQRVNERGEGGMAIAWGADDADETCAKLRAAGIAAEDPNDLERPLDLDGVREMVRFRNIMMPSLKLQDTMQFVCTHLTPHLTRARREWQLHAMGAIGLDEIVIVASNPNVASAQLAAKGVENVSVTLLSPTEVTARFGSDVLAGAPASGVVSLAICVNEIDAVAAILDVANIQFREQKNRLTLPARHAHGVVLEFV